MTIFEACEYARRTGWTCKSQIQGADVELGFKQRNPGLGLFEITYSRNGHKQKDICFSEAELDSTWQKCEKEGPNLKTLLDSLTDDGA